MPFREPSEIARIERAWRETPYDPAGSPVAITYRTDPERPGCVIADCTQVTIGGHSIGAIEYMAVEQSLGSSQPSVFLFQAGGFALRLPLSSISVEALGQDDNASPDDDNAPAPPEYDAWYDAFRARQAALKPTTRPTVPVSQWNATTKISDWDRGTTVAPLDLSPVPGITLDQLTACDTGAEAQPKALP